MASLVSYIALSLCLRKVRMKFLKRSKTRILLFLAVVGPGFITANVDNDAGGILTYSSAGAQFGHLLLWTMIPITLALIVVQEMCARMGAVTGKGLSDLIREEFGFRITFFMMIGILITNFGNVVTEFIGIATSLELFGLSQIHHRARVRRDCLADRGQRPVQERGESLPGRFVFLRDLHFRRRPGPSRCGRTRPSRPSNRPRCAPFATRRICSWSIGVVGTTIAPWMQFYLQASIVEKGVTKRGFKASRLDVVTGCVFTDIVAWFIIVACAATLYVHGFRDIKYAADAAQALKPLAGDYAYILFAVGLFNASLFAASILPLSTAYTVCEGLGFESGVGTEIRRSAGVLLALHPADRGGRCARAADPGQQLVKIALCLRW